MVFSNHEHKVPLKAFFRPPLESFWNQGPQDYYCQGRVGKVSYTVTSRRDLRVLFKIQLISFITKDRFSL